MRKYLFVTGGVVSSLGKGITMASIAMLMEKKGLKIAMLKLDPYLNVDPGTMNPFEHGEVYVTEDGAETDLDLGHYHRYTEAPLSKSSVSTSGQIYDTVIKKERRGDFLGKTVQVIPHITDEIKRRIESAGEKENADLVFVEIGGTVGDIESLPFLEAIRQFRYEKPTHCLNLHMTYIPYIKAAREIKTKPTQHSVQTIRSIGILPDIMICRTEKELTEEVIQKISLFCHLPPEAVLQARDVEHSIYELPLQLHAQGVDSLICQKFGLPQKITDLSAWKNLLATYLKPKGSITIGVVGKYMELHDAYKSVFEALEHAALSLGYRLHLKKIESDHADVIAELASCQGCLVPGGFGKRGFEGMIAAAHYCRTHALPYFGICLGMHVLVVEFARHVMGERLANSTEMDLTTPYPVISLLESQEGVEQKGGTMRLGAYSCELKPKTKAYEAYQNSSISERHRHRYELNNRYRAKLEEAGLCFSGICKEHDLCEVTEVKDHPWMVGVQFHPEFASKPTAAHPLFRNFLQAAIEKN